MKAYYLIPTNLLTQIVAELLGNKKAIYTIIDDTNGLVIVDCTDNEHATNIGKANVTLITFAEADTKAKTKYPQRTITKTDPITDEDKQVGVGPEDISVY